MREGDIKAQTPWIVWLIIYAAITIEHFLSPPAAHNTRLGIESKAYQDTRCQRRPQIASLRR